MTTRYDARPGIPLLLCLALIASIVLIPVAGCGGKGKGNTKREVRLNQPPKPPPKPAAKAPSKPAATPAPKPQPKTPEDHNHMPGMRMP